MDPYDKLRGSMGFPIDLELDRAMSTYKEKKLVAIYKGCENYVVKLRCCSENGTIKGFFNGFFYSPQQTFQNT